MANGITITNQIFTMLSNSQELAQLVPQERIWPLLANITDESEIRFPFIMYARTELRPSYNKGGRAMDEVTITVIVVDDQYKRSLEVASAVRSALEMHCWNDNNVVMDYIRLISCEEETIDDAYIQRLTFTTTVM